MSLKRGSFPCSFLSHPTLFASCSQLQLRPYSIHDANLSKKRTKRGAQKFSLAALPPSSSSSSSAAAILLHQSGIQLPERCSGCGIKLQQTHPEGPGYFIVPSKLVEIAAEKKGLGGLGGLGVPIPLTPRVTSTSEPEDEDNDIASPDDDEEDEYAKSKKDLERQAIESKLAKKQQSSSSDFSPSLLDDDLPDVICQRCYSLKHKGSVQVESAEGSLPDFDLGKKVGRKIFLQKDRKAVVLCVVDVWDFDGSLPRSALKSLYPPGTEQEAPDDLKFKLIVAVNKCDLLPSQSTYGRVDQWVRIRMKQSGLPRPDKVFMVSATKGSGVRDVVEAVKSGLGFRGDLWVVGAQNAGKSSLISAMKKLGGTSGKREPTIAPMPGTTLGLLNVPGLPLGPKHRAFDTPGVPHEHQMTTVLSSSLDEVKALLPSKQLKGRTYRVGAGNTLLIGGLARMDIVSCPGATLYLTVYVSHYVELHMGKTEGVEERMEKHLGSTLTPPYSKERVNELPAWQSTDLEVKGDSWSTHCADIHIAGLGWVGVGCKGRAEFKVWTYPQVSITTHEPLVLDFAEIFERPGFSSLLPKTAVKHRPAAKGGGKQPESDSGERKSSRGREGDLFE